MKKWFNEQITFIKKDWRLIAVKATLLLSGMFIMALGIRLYIPTDIGKSQVDFTIFTLIGLQVGSTNISSGDILKLYSKTLLYFYLVITLISALLSLINSIRKFKINKDKTIWLNFSFKIIADIIVSIILPLVVLMFQKIISDDKITNLLSTNGELNFGKSSWFFVLAFILYALGIALWVKSGWILGPYNSICQEFISLTKLKYGAARLIMDLMLVSPGLLLFLIIPTSSVSSVDFLFLNFSIVTMVFLFCTGPLVAQIINLINKFIDYNKLKRSLEPKQEL